MPHAARRHALRYSHRRHIQDGFGGKERFSIASYTSLATSTNQASSRGVRTISSTSIFGTFVFTSWTTRIRGRTPTVALLALRERTEDYATIVDGRKSIYDAFLAKPLYRAVRAARITQVQTSALVCLVFLRVSGIDDLTIHPVSTIPERDYERNVWRHRDRRDQLKIDKFPRKYTHKLGEKLPVEKTTVEPGLVHLRLGNAAAGLYAGWIAEKFWYLELTTDAPAPVDPEAQRASDEAMLFEDLGEE